MSKLPAAGTREAPQYSQASAEALLARFFQLSQLLALLSVTSAFALSLFSSVGWFWLLPAALLRALPFFAAFTIITLYRKTNIHLNYLPYPSAFAEAWARFLNKKFIVTVGIYLLSSVLFFFSYKFQMNDIGITTVNKAVYSLPRLNERNLYVNLFAFVISLVAAVLHVALDVDRLVFTFQDANLSAKERIVSTVPGLVQKAAVFSVGLNIVFPIIYLLSRSKIWYFCLPIVRRFVTLHHTDTYSGFPLSFGMFFNMVLAGFLLSFSWLFANMAFGIYMTLGPSHRGELISSKSSDKNGTLVTGLRSKKKQLICMLAFQELALIAFNKKDRRISIFADIDRKVTIWAGIKAECVGLLNDINTQLKKKAKKEEAKPVVPTKEEKLNSAGVIPIRDTNVFANKAQSHTIIENLQDKNASTSKEVISAVEQVKTQTYSRFKSYSKYVDSILDSPLGSFLRFTVERRARLLLPNPILTSTGVLALATLVCKSMEEDQYGTVQKDIPEILAKLAQTSTGLKNFIDNPPVHWSNKQEKLQKTPHALEDARNVLEAIDSSFEQIVIAFYDYLPSLNLSPEVIDMVNERFAD